MRCEFYSETIADAPKLSVDGTVDNLFGFRTGKGTKRPRYKGRQLNEIALKVAATANRETKECRFGDTGEEITPT